MNAHLTAGLEHVVVEQNLATSAGMATVEHNERNNYKNNVHEASRRHDEPLSRLGVILTATACIGGFLFGYDTGVISGAMLLIDADFDLTDIQEEVVVSVTIGAAAVASLAGGTCMQNWGRLPVIIFAGVVFTIGAVVLAAAQSYADLVIGRLIVGIGIGSASLTTPVYIAEAAPAHLRGKLVTLNTLFITGGQVIAGVVAGLFSSTNGGWRYMFGLSGIPSVLLVVGFLFLPESPRWLVSAGERRKALLALQAIRGTPDVHVEMDELVASATEGRVGVLKRRITVVGLLKDRRLRRALLLGCGMQLLQQFCGINTLMYYSAIIMSMAGFGEETSIWLTAVTAAAQSLGVLVGLHFIDACGRRPLVLSSLGMVIMALISLGIGFVVYDRSPSETYGWLIVVIMMLYLFTFGIGLSSVPWAFNAEVYPTHARSLGTSASTTANWVGNALVSATFLTLANSSLGKSGTFWLYAVIGILGWIWLYACMPETKRVSLEAVEHLLVRPGDPPVLQGDGVDDCGERVNSRVAEPAGTHAGSVMSGTDHRPDGFAPLVDDD